MQVPGVDYDLYARLAALLTAELQGSGGRVNPMAAPAAVLAVLAGGDMGAAVKISELRSAGAVGVDMSSLDGSLIDQGGTRRVQVQARVPVSEGTVMRVSRSVDLAGRSPNGEPWQTFRTSVDVESMPLKKP